MKTALQDFLKKFNDILDNQNERDMLYSKGTKNLRFRTLNGKIKFGVHDLDSKYESLLKLEQIARKEDALGDEEEQMLSELTNNLNILKKKEAKTQEQLKKDLSANKDVKQENEGDIEKEDEPNDEINENKPKIEQVLTQEEEMALERFKDYEKRLVTL